MLSGETAFDLLHMGGDEKPRNPVFGTWFITSMVSNPCVTDHSKSRFITINH